MEVGSAVHHASKEGGRVAYSVATDFVTLTGAGPHRLAALEVPVDAGVDVYPTLGEFANLFEVVRWRRFSGQQITRRGPAIKPRNRGGGSTESPVRLYTDFDLAGALSGRPTKQVAIAPGTPYTVPIDNVLRPGTVVVWTVQAARALAIPAGLTFEAGIYLEWHELPAAAD